MLLERAATLLTPAQATTPDEWARQNRRYPSTAGVPGPREPNLTAYLVPFGRVVHSGRYPRVVGVCGAQMGKTDTVLDCMGARLDQRPAPILYAGPKRDFVRDQFEPRLMALLDEAKTLAGKVVRGKRMKVSQKYIAGVKVRLASGQSSSDLKSDPFALGFVDEYDEMAANLKGQGDPLGLAEARGDTFDDFVTAVISTPSQGVVETEIDPVSGLEFWRVGDKEQILSPIWRLFQQGTRHHFAWPCPHCGEFFVPMRKHLAWPKGSTPAMARRSAHLVCPTNGCVIENDAKPDMIARGVMIAPGQSIEEARADENVPDASAWSCWVSGLCSPFVPWGVRAEKFLEASLSGEEDKVQTIVNAGFGELYTPGAAGDLPEWKAVLDKRLPYRRGVVPREVLKIVAGVDVQKRSLIYTIRGYGARGTSFLIEYGYLYGNTAEPKVWDDLSVKMTTPIAGRIIEKVFVDSGFRPDKQEFGDEHKVYEWCRRHSYIAMPTKGRQTLNGQAFTISKIDVTATGKRAGYSIDLVHVNTDYFKSLVHSRLTTPVGEPGAFYLYTDGKDPDGEAFEDYARQLVSEVRVFGDKMKPIWTKRQKDNHFLDAEALCAVAGFMLNVHTLPEGVTMDVGPSAFDYPVETTDEKPADDAGSVILAGNAADVAAAIRDRYRSMSGRSRG